MLMSMNLKPCYEPRQLFAFTFNGKWYHKKLCSIDFLLDAASNRVYTIQCVKKHVKKLVSVLNNFIVNFVSCNDSYTQPTF